MAARFFFLLAALSGGCGGTFIEVETQAESIGPGEIDQVVFNFLVDDTQAPFETRIIGADRLPVFVVFEPGESVPTSLRLEIEALENNEIRVGRSVDFEYSRDEINQLTVELVPPRLSP